MIIITSSYSNSHRAHLLLMNVLLMVLAVFTMSCHRSSSVTPLESKPRAIFVFGDSLVDPGNNNYISGTLAKNNFYPFGIDFPIGKTFTGCFTNGRTIIDIIGEELGVKDYIPPYMDPTTVGDVVLRGVNYASGGAGILNDTGAIFGNRFNMDAQLDNFANTRNYIISNISGVGSKKLLEKALFLVVMGSNEFIDNYFTPIVSIPKQKLVSPEIFVDSMISKFRLQLTRLYKMDARKIAVANVGPVGCIPIERALNYKSWYTTSDSCISAMNNAAMVFNKKLKSLIIELNSNLVQSKFVYVDSYGVISHIFHNYKSYGFEDYKTACWKVLPDSSWKLYKPAPLVCKDRSKYVFWDFAHPTEATYVIFANKVLEDRDSSYTYPMNIRQLYYS
ncbi:GDSL esterase/lipase At4g16230-like [Papaver somniferum]|uniref:GDSL esterase/lipase At4g16230-like n=1 Tax=Papaver somniferum TaxID=3469 RepID=UPI000E6FE143|nr:GDSL esterase/lipase At4g16230-like [Papaver somniferum]